MIKIVIAVLFAIVLCIDFIVEISRKKVDCGELFIRGFMLVAGAYFLSCI